MFKVSTKGDYALLIMTALAMRRGNGEFVSLKKIAEEKRLPFAYISQLMLRLKKVGLVESKEGLNGGYRLKKEPSNISLMEILEATEGKISPVKCCSEKSGPCQCESVCGVKYAWQDAIQLLDQFFSAKKLSDLMEQPDTSSTASSPITFIS